MVAWKTFARIENRFAQCRSAVREIEGYVDQGESLRQEGPFRDQTGCVS